MTRPHDRELIARVRLAGYPVRPAVVEVIAPALAVELQPGSTSAGPTLGVDVDEPVEGRVERR